MCIRDRGADRAARRRPSPRRGRALWLRRRPRSVQHASMAGRGGAGLPAGLGALAAPAGPGLDRHPRGPGRPDPGRARRRRPRPCGPRGGWFRSRRGGSPGGGGDGVVGALPVSYTHLAVYKRQTSTCTAQFLRPARLGEDCLLYTSRCV